MTLQLPVVPVGRIFRPEKKVEGGFTIFTVDVTNKFDVHFPGRIVSTVRATFDQTKTKNLPHGGSTVIRETIDIPCTLKVFTPNGVEFKKKDISLLDLRKFRTPRGRPNGQWSCKLVGQTAPIPVDPVSPVHDSDGFLSLKIVENVSDDSAAPLVDNQPIPKAGARFTFDLYRVGLFTTEIFTVLPWKGTTRLIDPSGQVVATTSGKRLTFDVGLQHLRKPRDAGKLATAIPKWTLEVTPRATALVTQARISATVVASMVIRTAAITDRVGKLIGPRGSFVKVFGENREGQAIARFVITDPVAAETINMHGLGKRFILDPEPGGDIVPGKAYTIRRAAEEKTFKVKTVSLTLGFNVSRIKLGAIEFGVGPGDKLGASVPAVRLSIAVSGEAVVTFKGVKVATAKVRGGRIDVEIGIRFEPDGTAKIVKSFPVKLVDIDISIRAAALGTLLAGIPLAILETAIELKERDVNAGLVEVVDALFSEPTLVPLTLLMINGGHFRYLPPRMAGDAIFLDYVAPVEPEPRPDPRYIGAIGRKVEQPRPGAVNFTPAAMADTWTAGKLGKIEHVVVVMMENRSYDHVLGYRARPPISDGAAGLTEAVVNAVQSASTGTLTDEATFPGGDKVKDGPSSQPPFRVRNLKDAGFASNSSGLKTLFPKSVGHRFTDVTEQLRFKARGPSGASDINSPRGFRDNFKPHLGANAEGVVADDVLGFYDAASLPFFAYLAENYAYCDQYFSSHPGPTLPNRFYSLVGDLDRDRTAVPVLENSNAPDLFKLSRAHTIYDFLTRFGHDFRVYESFPSLTMLRLFARYATDTDKIVSLGDNFERLRADVKKGDLPALVAIEPRMHSAPENDDHTPDADMLLGQRFIKGVYDALRANPAVWAKTLLVVTYDEHGGFYDHVVPHAADVRGVDRDPSVLITDPVDVGIPGAGGDKTKPAASPAEIIPYGVRVPTFLVSPWVARGKVVSEVFDHCSILKTVLARFAGDARPFMSDRVEASRSFNEVLTEAAPRMNVPDFVFPMPAPVPDPAKKRIAPSRTTRIVTPPITRRQLDEGRVDYHSLTGWWARQLGR